MIKSRNRSRAPAHSGVRRESKFHPHTWLAQILTFRVPTGRRASRDLQKNSVPFHEWRWVLSSSRVRADDKPVCERRRKCSIDETALQFAVANGVDSFSDRYGRGLEESNRLFFHKEIHQIDLKPCKFECVEPSSFS